MAPDDTNEGGDQVSFEEIDITSAVFVRRFAALLSAHRQRTKQYLWRLSRRSDGRYSVEDLQDIEAGLWPVGADDVSALLDLYGTNLDSLLPPRVRLHVDPSGTVAANGTEKSFDPGQPLGLLSAYLDLVRTLRDQLDRTVIELRREDVEVLADHLQDVGSSVVLQLARLMGANERERRAMAAMFIAGANVIAVSTPPRQRADERAMATIGGRGELAARPPCDPDHPSRYHVVIPQRAHELGSVTVLADWIRPPRD